MRESSIQFAWREPQATDRFRTGVSLHSHTMHSEECLAFLPRHLHTAPGISQIVTYYERARHVDFARAWWTPPLSPASALSLEREQIAKLGLRPVVSITDHDNIQAGLALGITADASDTPISVEWTVPYERTILHLGIHNIPRGAAKSWMEIMAQHTAKPDASALPGLLHDFSGVPEVLIVLNHPYWLEEGIIEADHRPALDRVIRECAAFFDALELNGTRPWKENARVVDLARSMERPLISGGDRHCCEPNACLNLTNARTFSEFVSEIHAGCSSILFMPQYREPMAQRVLEAARDILATYPEYPGRERWSDRIFYRDDDGVVRTVAQICNRREPRLVAAGVTAVQFFAGAGFRPALRMLFSALGEQHP